LGGAGREGRGEEGSGDKHFKLAFVELKL